MVQLLAGFQVSQALYAAAKTGFTDALADGPRPVDELADVLQLHAPSLARLARTLTGLGVLTDTGSGSYALTPLGHTLVSDDPTSVRDLALTWMETHYAPFAGLTETVRTGRPAATEFYGTPFFDWLGGHPDQVERFTGAMANLTDGIKRGAISARNWSSVRRVMDVGGADGALLAQVLGSNEKATGTVLDLPHVVPAVALAAKEAGLEDRLDSVAGDFFTSVPGGYDTYVMSMILHDWDDDSARRILANIAAAAEAGARVVALELVVPPGDAPHMSKMIDLTMLGMLTGKERTAIELRALVESAGLSFRGITPTPTPLSFIEAEVVATA
jgi:hypothetical protein